MKSVGNSINGQNKILAEAEKGGSGFFIDSHQLMQDSPLAFYICDTEGYLKFFNQAAAKIWGKSPKIDKDQYFGYWKIHNLEGTALPIEEFPTAKVLNTKKACKNEKIIIEAPDGSLSTLLIFSQPIFDDEKNFRGASNTLVDITEHQDGQIKESILSSIVESSDDAIISKDLNGKITSWNLGAEKIFGYTEEEAVGKSITILIPEDRQKEETHIISQIRSGEKVDHFQTMRIAKNGKKIPVSLTVSPIKNSFGTIVGASKISRDISSQIEAQLTIEKKFKKLKILNSIGKSISENLDVQDVLQRVTDETTKLTGAAFGAFFYNNIKEKGDSFRLFTLSGAPRESFEKLGMPRHTSLFHPTFVDKKIVRIDDITKDPRYGKNFPHKGMPSGHFSVFSYLAVPVISKTGNVIGGLLFGHPQKAVFNEEHEEMVINIAAQAAFSLDNSQLFEQVKSLSDKKDEFIALASHELKTPLTTIKGYLQILSKKKKDQMTELFLKKSLYQVNKLNTLVDDLLNMSRIESGKLDFNLEIFDLRQVLLEITEVFDYSHKSHKLLHSLGENPVFVKGDKQRIEQAVVNLMNNAVKYSPKADKVYLNMETNDDKVTVKVKDHGIGLTKEQQEQLFTRFYRAESTKGISGLGLGLYLTKQIIDRHEGVIKVKSEYGKGSEFSFSLAIAEEGKKKSSTK